RVLHRVGQRRKAEAAPVEELDEIRQHLRVKRADVHQKHIRYVAAIQSVGQITEDRNVLIGRSQVTRAKSLDRLLILLGHATRIWSVPEIVLKVHRDLRDLIAVLFEVGADGVALLQRIALPQE